MSTAECVLAAAIATRDATIAEMLGDAGVPPRALAVARAPGIVTPALQAVRDHAGDTFLVLLGAPGTGKSVAAAAWLQDYATTRMKRQTARDDAGNEIDYRYVWRDEFPKPEKFSFAHHKAPRVLWMGAGALSRIDRFRGAEDVERVTMAHALVLDDLGAEYADAKGWYLAMLDEAIDVRYSHTRRTLITSNLDGTGFAARYGDRVVDRIREVGRFVGTGAESLRVRARS